MDRETDEALTCAYVTLLNAPMVFRARPATQKALAMLRDAIAARDRIDAEFVQNRMELLARAMRGCWE